MGELVSAVDLTQSLLERLPFGVAVIDPRLRVLALNERGRRGLTSFGPASRWHQPIPGSGHSLEQIIRNACKPRDPASVQAVALRAPTQASCNVLVLPLTVGHRLSGGWQHPTALMIFSEVRPPTRLLPDILRELYGLNRSEARLALSLADGSGLPAVAASLRITRETARSTLKIVFRKTGASSQSQLVKLLAALTVIDTAR
jgi:DNA-binding CsgD family transcriptional regulator